MVGMQLSTNFAQAQTLFDTYKSVSSAIQNYTHGNQAHK